jgi:hypothetical protein
MLDEADYSLTSMAMGQSATNPGDETLLVKFYSEPVQDAAKSEAEGRPIFVDKDMIMIRVPGQANPLKNTIATDFDKRRFPEHYRKYKERVSQVPVEGTPLAQWPGISRSQVEEFRFFNIVTVEQLANMSDAHSHKFMGINALKAKAKAYLEASSTQAAINRENAVNKQLEEQLAVNQSLTEANDKLEARLKMLEEMIALKPVDEIPRKRPGRPPKAVVE